MIPIGFLSLEICPIDIVLGALSVILMVLGLPNFELFGQSCGSRCVTEVLGEQST